MKRIDDYSYLYYSYSFKFRMCRHIAAAKYITRSPYDNILPNNLFDFMLEKTLIKNKRNLKD